MTWPRLIGTGIPRVESRSGKERSAVFKRRTPKSYAQSFAEFFYPRGGWSRAARYVVYRLRRLPDPAHKISRGIGAGVFACFTPFFGLHFVTAGLIAYLIRGNILASLLATFFGNPVTFPVIATISVEFGTWLLGLPAVPPKEILLGFSLASVEIWGNFAAIFTPETASWDETAAFFTRIFVPYLVGGLAPGIMMGFAAYFMANPVIASYQMGRIKKLKQRFEARRRMIESQKSKDAAAAKDLLSHE